MRFDPGLEALFALLQEHELPCGLEEIGRLKAVFSLQPELDQDGLRRVLEAIIVKSVDQHEMFRRAYSKWLTSIDSYLDELESRKNKAITATMVKDISPAPRAPAPATPSRRARKARTLEPDFRPLAHAGAAAGVTSQSAVGDEVADPRSEATSQQSTRTAQAEPATTNGYNQKKRVDRGLPEATPQGHKQIASVAIAVVFAFVGALLASVLLWDSADNDHHPGVDAGPTSSNGFDAAANPEIASYPRFVVPEIIIETDQPPPFNWLGLAMAALALAMFIGLCVRYARGRWLPRTMPPRRLPRAALIVSPGRVPGRGDDEVLLLDEDDEDNLIWGVGRFISEEESRDLDVEQSVGETAAAFGRPVLRYERARYQREVWLWVDESIGSPVARHLARDLARLLERSGLPVTRAEFWGIPDRLRSEKGEVLIVDELDARRDSVAVAILTDGRIMAAAHRARDRRGELDRLLRSLSRWPRVTFIDFARDNRQLAAVVATHDLRVILPRESAAAVSDLASIEPQQAEYDELAGDAQVWAAACAISPQPVDDRTALSLRRLLGLDVTPWVIEAMRDRAASNAGGLRWSLAQRANLLDWLVESEELPDDLSKRRIKGFPFRIYTVKLPPSCLLDRIVDAWNQLLDEREREGRKHDPEWETSRRAQEIALERAFVHLWDMPNRSSAAIHEMYSSGRLGRTIRHHMRQMAPRECSEHGHDRDDVIILPWRLSNLRRETQVRLTEMGFGSKVRVQGTQSMPRPGRLYLALGLCLGLLGGAVASLVNTHLLARPAPPAVIADPAEDSMRVDVTHDCDGGTIPCTVIARTPIALLGGDPLAGSSSYAETGVGPDAEVRADMGSGGHGESGQARATLTWRETARIRWVKELALPCAEQQNSEYGTVVVWRCDSTGKAPVRTDDRWSFAAIHADLEQRGLFDLAERVARELLDSGSVDGVYLTYSPDGFAAIPWAMLARPGRSDQLLVVAERVPAGLEDYPGNAVVIALDSIGTLSGITDGFGAGFDGAPIQTLAARLADGMAPDTLAGSLEDFRIRGQGACGLAGQRCCYGSADECDPGLGCVDDQCVALPRKCQAGTERRCDEANYVQICDDTGTQWIDETDCGTQRCVDGVCRDVVCQPDEWDCVDDQTMRLCNATGTGSAGTRSCSEGICVEGECRARECEPGERLCAQDDRSYYVCDSRGTGWQDRIQCKPGQVCIDGGCRARTCTPSTSRCTDHGRSYKLCDSAGTRELRIPCPTGKLCRGDGCQLIRHADVDFKAPRLSIEPAPDDDKKPDDRPSIDGTGQAEKSQGLVRSIALRCSVTGAGSVNLTPRRSQAAGGSLRAPYRKTAKGKASDPGFTVTCGLSILGKQTVAASREHEWDLRAEGSHRLALELDIERIRDQIPKTRELPQFDWGRVRLVIDYDVALKLKRPKTKTPSSGGSRGSQSRDPESAGPQPAGPGSEGSATE